MVYKKTKIMAMLEAPGGNHEGDEEFPFPRGMSKSIYLEPVADLATGDYWTREDKWRKFWEEQNQIEPKSGRSRWYDNKISRCYRNISDDSGNYVGKIEIKREEKGYYTPNPLFQPDNPRTRRVRLNVDIRFRVLVFSEESLMQNEFRKIAETELAGLFSIRDSSEPIATEVVY